MNAQLKAALASYARSVLAAATALYLAGVTNPADLAKALLAGLLPVIIRSLNKKDPAFGLVAKAAEPYIAKLSDGEPLIPKEYLKANAKAVEKLVKEAKVTAVNKPATKPAAKKASTKKADPK